MAAAARPRGQVDVEVAVAAANLEPSALGQRGQRPLYQEMAAPVEAQLVKVDSRQR
jgi:hypothetical protein